MRIKLLADYRGVLTDERFYTAGEYAIPGDMPEAQAQALIAAQRAEEIEKAPPDNQKRTITKRSRARKKAA